MSREMKDDLRAVEKQGKMTFGFILLIECWGLSGVVYVLVLAGDDQDFICLQTSTCG